MLFCADVIYICICNLETELNVGEIFVHLGKAGFWVSLAKKANKVKYKNVEMECSLFIVRVYTSLA